MPNIDAKQKKIMLVFGTRPEAIKMCPLVKELRSRKEFAVCVCVTGQHREMLKQVLDCFDVTPDYNLDIMQKSQTLFDITAAVITRMKPVLEKEMPDIVLVHGDTTTAYCTAVAAFYMQIPVGHVEAGLRTYNLASPFPEEFNRQSISVLAKLNFAPTQTARDNLLKENRAADSIFVTGNTAIDALKTTVKKDCESPYAKAANGRRIVLLTAHRRENSGEPFEHIFSAVRRLADENKDIYVIYPLHMNPAVRKIAHEYLDGAENISLIEPLDVIEFHNLMARSYLILTDSGGIQEEAPALGKPVLVMRDTTERPEGIAAGTLKLTGTSEEEIYTSAKRLLNDKNEYNAMAHAENPYGDGTACAQIAEILKRVDF